MDTEHQILNQIEKNNNTSQRELAKQTGISLGNVNTLIKRLARKGLLKIERLNANTIKYVLTPKGLKEKAEATYNYIVSSYRYIHAVEKEIELIMGQVPCGKREMIYLYGDSDELYVIISRKLQAMDIEYLSINEKPVSEDLNNGIFITWHPDFEENLKKLSIPYYSILESIK